MFNQKNINTVRSYKNRPISSNPFLIKTTQSQKIVNRQNTFITQNIQSTQNLIDKGIKIQDILNIYKAKCQDNYIDFNDEHGLKFIERFKKDQKKNKLIFQDEHFKLKSAKIISNIILKTDNIYHLELSNNEFCGESIQLLSKAISQSKSLISVHLISNNLGPQEFDYFLLNIQNNKYIVRLDFKSLMGQFRNKITNSIILKQYIIQNNVIQHLCLSRCSLQLKGLSYILQGMCVNNSLTVLDISCNNLGHKCCNLITKYLKKSNLEELNLQTNNIMNAGINQLAVLFINHPNFLKILNLADNQITCEGLKILLDQLVSNEQMTRLHLDRNKFHDKDCFQILSTYLLQNQVIQELYLQKSQLYIYEMQKFQESLQRNQSLQILNLNNNELYESGAQYIAQGLQSNNSIKQLHLAYCKITDQGGQDLINAIQSHQNLRVLDLRYNLLKDDCGKLIIKLLEKNKRLKKIWSEKNLMSSKTQQNINQILEYNKDKLLKLKPQIVNKKIEYLKDFESQKYEQYKIQDKLNNIQASHREIIQQQQSTYECENQRQQEDEEKINQIQVDLFQQECNSQKILNEHERQWNNQIDELIQQKEQINEETSHLIAKVNYLNNLTIQKKQKKLVNNIFFHFI